MIRKRTRLVPRKGLEVFEVRIVLYFDKDSGEPIIGYDVDTPDNSGSRDIPIHEILGAITYATQCMVDDHLKGLDGDV